MKHLNQTHNRILSNLLKSRGKLDSYTLFRRSMLSFSEFSHAMRVISSDGYVQEEDNIVTLSQKGREYIVKLVPAQGELHTWRTVPEKYRTPPLTEDELYIPDIELLDKKTFKLHVSHVD